MASVPGLGRVGTRSGAALSALAPWAWRLEQQGGTAGLGSLRFEVEGGAQPGRGVLRDAGHPEGKAAAPQCSGPRPAAAEAGREVATACCGPLNDRGLLLKTTRGRETRPGHRQPPRVPALARGLCAPQNILRGPLQGAPRPRSKAAVRSPAELSCRGARVTQGGGPPHRPSGQRHGLRGLRNTTPLAAASAACQTSWKTEITTRSHNGQ